jgi:malate/lactate dehydrogenase
MRCGCLRAPAVVRGSVRTIVIVDRTRKRAEAVASDLRYGAPLCPMTTLVDGDYEDFANSELEDSVRYANITIIEGNEASQFGIGIVAARRSCRSVVSTRTLASSYRFRASSDAAA